MCGFTGAGYVSVATLALGSTVDFHLFLSHLHLLFGLWDMGLSFFNVELRMCFSLSLFAAAKQTPLGTYPTCLPLVGTLLHKHYSDQYVG